MALAYKGPFPLLCHGGNREIGGGNGASGGEYICRQRRRHRRMFPQLSNIANMVELPSAEGAALGRSGLGIIDEAAEQKWEIRTDVVCILGSESMA